MAEGWARHLFPGSVEPFSAGTLAKGLDPRAVKVMAEAGVDISCRRSKTLAELPGGGFDLVITVCDKARESCPLFPGRTRRLHRSFDDPPFLARDAKDEEDALKPYRRVRDELRAFVETLPAILDQENAR
jgi:arsenate reductase